MIINYLRSLLFTTVLNQSQRTRDKYTLFSKKLNKKYIFKT